MTVTTASPNGFGVDVNCPVCASPGRRWAFAKDVEYLTTPNTYEYRVCDCEVLYLADPPVDQLDVIYPNTYYSYSLNGRGLAELAKSVLDRRMFKSVLRTLQFPVLRILDVGGGSGYYSDILNSADSRVSSTTIVDLDPDLRILVEQKGYTFINSKIQDANLEKKFHLIIAFNLIEHVSDPTSLLKQFFGLLEPGGALILQTPNFKSLDARLFRNHSWGGLHAPRHWVIFSAGSLAASLEKVGFDSWKIRHVQGAPFWAVGILARWSRLRTYQERSLPMYKSRTYKVLLMLFGAVDLCRSTLGFKTSQMYVTVRKAPQ
jgi:SAM-dependent methyltransferase